MRTVYIETSIPSYYHESRSDPTALAWRAATRQWWDLHRDRYHLLTSQFVLAELSLAPAPKGSKCLSLLQGIQLLELPKGLEEVVEYYMEHRLMPAEAGGDAFHWAMASLHNIDFLLTWNCRHLANANKALHMKVLNGRLGLPVPIVTTPLTLLPESENERG